MHTGSMYEYVVLFWNSYFYNVRDIVVICHKARRHHLQIIYATLRLSYIICFASYELMVFKTVKLCQVFLETKNPTIMEGLRQVLGQFLVKLDLVLLCLLQVGQYTRTNIHRLCSYIFQVWLKTIYLNDKVHSRNMGEKNFTFGLSVTVGPKFGRRTQKRGRLEMWKPKKCSSFP